MTETGTYQGQLADTLPSATAAEHEEAIPVPQPMEDESGRRSIWEITYLTGAVAVVGTAIGEIENIAGMKAAAEHAFQLSGQIGIVALAAAGLTLAWRKLGGRRWSN